MPPFIIVIVTLFMSLVFATHIPMADWDNINAGWQRSNRARKAMKSCVGAWSISPEEDDDILKQLTSPSSAVFYLPELGNFSSNLHVAGQDDSL
ncbi:hypothetical protein BDZ45DRAFT_752758 [Acephala macrosclerotiorum]|nr:hypothetical protein BDZ45DRAFT_752758 [Acephala macrosclerotiorum]